jgi:hypothetical protein
MMAPGISCLRKVPTGWRRVLCFSANLLLFFADICRDGERIRRTERPTGIADT